MKRVVLLGATGSIGVQALDVVASHPDLQLVGLAAATSVEATLTAAAAHGVDRVAFADPAAASRARARFPGEILSGGDGVAELVRTSDADVVLNAIVGFAGLRASLATLEAGSDLALANKESLVAGGPLVQAALARSGRRLLPVDSEHSALFQCVGGADAATIVSLVITASGGPFRGRSLNDLREVAIADALAHPTWEMGARVTIDSATLMNKGLEVIEAHVLFGLPYERIEVVVHPQSIVHGMARLRDGALLAHVGVPDMRVPISYALTHPERRATSAAALDLSTAFSLDFEPPDLATFRCLALAIEAGETGGTAPCVLNAADEAAVAAFLGGEIRFLDIAALVERALDEIEVRPVDAVETLQRADAAARASVRAAIKSRSVAV